MSASNYNSINSDDASMKDSWELAQSGTVTINENIFASERSYANIANFDPDAQFLEDKKKHELKKLGQFRATAIAGNDITSSCLYTVGLAMLTAGKMAPFSLALVAILLYLYRNIYSEVGAALPLNGGAYNALLNTTSKAVAAFAAVLTILSYVATAVVSASEACGYLQLMWQHESISIFNVDFNITFTLFGSTVELTLAFWFTFVILFIFALLNIIGITESAVVALVIFFVHLLTLLTLIVTCFVYVIQNPHVLQQNWYNSSPIHGHYVWDIYLGFSAALLGVTGFESSANYIEEQKSGVFPKTLRNMWFLVAMLNPVLSVLALGVVPSRYEFVTFQSSIVAQMGYEAVEGSWLGDWVCIDAFLVLCGSVLTAYVGVTGLIRRMALDRCLPQFFLKENSLRHTNHYIIIAFFLVTSSMYAIVLGNVVTLSGMYSVAFLGVMALFAVGNMLLKYKRDEIPRAIRAHWFSVLIGLVGVVAGLLGNIILDIDILAYFSIYFAITFTLVMFMFSRVFFMRLLLYFLRKTPLYKFMGGKLEDYAQSFKDQSVIFFAKTDDPAVLNKAILYIRDNEQTRNITIVHVNRPNVQPPPKLIEYVQVLDAMYPKLTINLEIIQGNFGPAIVRRISKKMGVPPNFMFITCIDSKFTSSIQDFGGVRLITH